MGLDARVLAFSVGLCVLTTGLFGVLPSLLLARGDLAAVRGEMRSALGHRTQWLQSGLVVFEVALALAPLLGAALVLQSMERLLHQDPGFRPEHAVAFRVQLAPERYRDDASKRAMLAAFLPRLRALPGVSYAGAINDLPLSGSNTNGNFSIEGQTFDKAHEPAIEYRLASPGYVEAMGIPLKEGRSLEESDRAGAEPVALVNVEAVRRFWAGTVAARRADPPRRRRGAPAVAADRRRGGGRPPRRPRREAAAGDVLPARPGHLRPADLRAPEP